MSNTALFLQVTMKRYGQFGKLTPGLGTNRNLSYPTDFLSPLSLSLFYPSLSCLPLYEQFVEMHLATFLRKEIGNVAVPKELACHGLPPRPSRHAGHY